MGQVATSTSFEFTTIVSEFAFQTFAFIECKLDFSRRGYLLVVNKEMEITVAPLNYTPSVRNPSAALDQVEYLNLCISCQAPQLNSLSCLNLTALAE